MDILPLLERLRVTDTTEDKQKALDDILNTLVDPENEDVTEALGTDMIEKGLLDDLSSMAKDDTIIAKVAQIVAEVAKNESVREPSVEKGFVPLFLKILEANDDTASMTQACRALGNICYDNDLGREVVNDNNGISILLSLLRSLLSNTTADADRLRTISCGFLLNLTNTNEVLQQKALDGGALDIMTDYLQGYQQEDGLCNMILVTIGSLTDSDSCKEKLLSSSLLVTLVNLLMSPHSDVHYESILDILINLAEMDEVKDQLAITPLCGHLIQLAQLNVKDNPDLTEENQQKVKLASDLLILLLTGEKSMDILFDDGKGEIFSESLKWLESKEEHLQLSGALAVGNFARSDEHCKFLVEQGVVRRLLALVKPVFGETKCTIEHAALSALRNLAIPASNKAALIKAGVIDAVLVLVDSELLAVTFKLLGVLRMLVDGQEEAALRLGQDRDFIIRLVEWSACEEHPGVKGESTRLLAWIIKNSRTDEVMRNVVRADGISHLVTMAISEHVVMQNEALIALTLIASTVLGEAALSLKESDITQIIMTLLKDDHTLPEILCNTLTLTRTICTADNLREELLGSSLAEVVKQLCEHEDDKVKEAAKSLQVYMVETPPALDR